MSNTSLEDPVVEIESGLIKGRNRRGVQTFFDIPYAAPPVGELRFALLNLLFLGKMYVMLNGRGKQLLNFLAKDLRIVFLCHGKKIV